MALNDVKEIQIPDSRYRQLEYIHFSGGEYIDTNKTLTGPNTYKRVIMKISFQDVNRWSYCGYIDGTNNFAFGTRPTNLATFSLGAASYGTNSYALSTNTIYQYDVWVNNANSNSLAISDESGTVLWTSSALSASWSGNTGNLYIGACHDARIPGPSGYMVANIYSFTVRQPSYGVIVYNGIPCQRKSDGVCGMYDTISNTFNPMVGTEITDNAAGTIIAENMLMYVNKIESNNQIIWGSQTYFPYRKLEYIHFSGAEGIDLGFKPASSGNTGVQALNARITGPTGSGTYGVILGCSGDSATGGAMRVLVQSYEGNVGQRIGRNSSTFGYSTPMAPTKFYNYRLRTTSSSSTYVDIYNDQGQLISGTNHTTSVSYTSANMPNEQLMRYISNGVLIAGGYSTGDVAFFKQWDGSQATGTLIKDMYPAQRKSDGVCGLYDVLNSTFYPMIGTSITSGAAGPIADEYWDLTA